MQEQTYCARCIRPDPFKERIARVRADLLIKRLDYQAAFRCADKLTGTDRKAAVSYAKRIQLQAAELAAELAMLAAGR